MERTETDFLGLSEALGLWREAEPLWQQRVGDKKGICFG